LLAKGVQFALFGGVDAVIFRSNIDDPVLPADPVHASLPTATVSLECNIDFETKVR
jgi:hypothetical protein